MQTGQYHQQLNELANHLLEAGASKQTVDRVITYLERLIQGDPPEEVLKKLVPQIRALLDEAQKRP